MKTMTRASNVAISIINAKRSAGHVPHAELVSMLSEAFCLGYVQGRQGETLTDWEEAAQQFGIKTLGPSDYK